MSQGYMSKSLCNLLCIRYKYFGLQYGSQCWCGNRYGRYGHAKHSDCNKRCQGNRHSKCGGTWRNRIYLVDKGNGMAVQSLNLSSVPNATAALPWLPQEPNKMAATGVHELTSITI